MGFIPYDEINFYNRCPKCGHFTSYKHIEEVAKRGIEYWDYCPACLEKEIPNWSSLPEYRGLFCSICGEKSGNTDLCVECSTRLIEREKRVLSYT